MPRVRRGQQGKCRKCRNVAVFSNFLSGCVAGFALQCCLSLSTGLPDKAFKRGFDVIEVAFGCFAQKEMKGARKMRLIRIA